MELAVLEKCFAISGRTSTVETRPQDTCSNIRDELKILPLAYAEYLRP